jgi:hypothetical protein
VFRRTVIHKYAESRWFSLLNSSDFGWPRQRDEETRRKVFREQEARK